jgi:hypothetical protein
MSITPEFTELINRLNQELDQTEQQATRGLNRTRDLLSRFSDNAIILESYAFLNATQLFVENSRRQLREAVEFVSLATVSNEEVQEAGEELASLLGKTIEVKLRIERIIARLE